MSSGVFTLPQPVNEPVRDYAPGSPERASLKSRLDAMASEQIDIPMVIGGKEVRTGRTARSVMPHRKDHVLAEVAQPVDHVLIISRGKLVRESRLDELTAGMGGAVRVRSPEAAKLRAALERDGIA